MIYFVQSGNHVKIGYAFNPRKRIYELQISHPNQLHPLLIITGSFDIEHELHHKFKQYKTHGEWFELSDEIKMFINDHLDVDRRYECGYIDSDYDCNQQIQYWRKNAKLTVQQVADKMGVKGPTYHSMERNEPKSNIGIRTLERIADALNCKFEYRFVPKK